MGKNIKSYATTQTHSPQGREGSLTANNPNLSATNVIWLNRTHSFLNLQQNFSNKIFHSRFCTLANFQQIKQNSLKFAYILRELRKICTNY